jgi:glucoamylase
MMARGRPTGGAMPLVWAHAEYLKLVRSALDGKVFDRIPEVADRYLRGRASRPMEVWKFNRQVGKVPAGATLRIQSSAPFRLHWSSDEWRQIHETSSTDTVIGEHFADIPVSPDQRAPIRFTFFWTKKERWEGTDFEVAMA